MQPYPIPAAQARSEIEVLHSRFIATAAPAFRVEQAREWMQQVRREFPDASHHVPAFVIGHGSSVLAHCHDDGEPSGTAGRPVLAVLQGSGLGDIVVVVTRYFGGIKLGTGGLVRAYGDAARAVLDVLPRAEKAATHVLRIAAPYAAFEPARRILAEHGASMLNEEFGATVVLTARIRTSGFQGLQVELSEYSNGALKAEIVATDVATILPLPDQTHR
jgi:uncharacterized YigZ family protein